MRPLFTSIIRADRSLVSCHRDPELHPLGNRGARSVSQFCAGKVEWRREKINNIGIDVFDNAV